MAVVLLTTTGNVTWSVPADVTNIVVTVSGAGASGGSGTGNMGGGSGGMSTKAMVVTPGSSISGFIGSGGVPSSGQVRAGGSTWFVSTTTVFANGAPNQIANTSAPGGSTTGAYGDTVVAGLSNAQNAVNGQNSPYGGLGGAGSAGGTNGVNGGVGAGGGHSYGTPGQGGRGEIKITYDDPPTVVTATGSGSTTFPAGMDTAKVEVWSGGQGGWIEGGGHGGNFVQSTLTGAPGSTINFMVGAGGAGSVYSQNNGGDSWVGSATTILAKGGGNRSGNIGTVSFYGGLGDRTNYQNTGGQLLGGGGGSAHPLGNGGNAAAFNGGATGLYGGSSGSTAGGAGAGSSNVEGGAGGGGSGTNAGGSPGGGGGGSPSMGGVGGRGQIRLTFTSSGGGTTPPGPTRKAPRSVFVQ